VVGFVLGSAAIAGLATLGGPLPGAVAGTVCGALTLWCIWFFRDPRRRIPQRVGGKRAVVCPADGVVCAIGAAMPPDELRMKPEEWRGATRVSVFMNVFDVHVNRAPAEGTVEKLAYHSGKFFNASLDKASADNERMSMALRMADGTALVCVQIAGLIARRIVCRVKEGAKLAAGERYGVIRFGSRVDVYLPRGIEPMVKVGERVVAGETVVAVLPVAGAGAGGAAANGDAGAAATSAERQTQTAER